MIWNRVCGHGTQIEMFRQSLRSGRFSQAYLLTGPEGIGKRLFVRTLAQCLFCAETTDEELDACGQCPQCRQMQAGSHPDYLSIGCPAGKNILPIELIAGSKDRRGREGLCYDLTLRPMSAQRRIAVIDDAHRMNQESQNAFLKTLEEPPSFATLFLLAPNSGALLPTIQSRCQAVRFSPLSDDVVSRLLQEQNLIDVPPDADAVAALSEGSLTLAKQLLDPQIRDLREELFRGLSTPRYDAIAIAKTVLDGLDELGGDSHQKRRNAGWFVSFTMEFFRRVLRQLSAPGTSSPIPQVDQFAARFYAEYCGDHEVILACLDCCLAAETQLARNTPAAMVFENLFANIGRQLRQHASA